MMRREIGGIGRSKLSVLVAGCLLLGAVIVLGSVGGAADLSLPEANTDAPSAGAVDYSNFQHRDPTHARMPCLLCHKREDSSAAPKFASHVTCSGCHEQQFADRGSQICTICHTNAESGAMKRFPRLRNFDSRFDHARHSRQTGCATCHQPSRRGVALSVPAGLSAHNACYQCHGPRTEIGGKNIGSCSTCHQLGRPSRNSDQAAAYAKNFSHAEHRAAKLDCSSCHTVRAGMARGRQVTAPAASMHFASGRTLSCATCHDNRRAFGGTDFADCKRCHEGKTFRF